MRLKSGAGGAIHKQERKFCSYGGSPWSNGVPTWNTGGSHWAVNHSGTVAIIGAVVAQSEANVTSWSKGYSKPWSPIPGSHEEPQLELKGILEQSCWRFTLLEAHLAGGYLCPKLLIESKVVTKIHLGAERSILRSGGSSREDHPLEVESILGQKRLILESWRITLEP